ncbi:MAG: YkgJ family cysteine cluster protein [Deltaproteobacteria bacterium]|jgi:Fe-S-cluster containining protein|nr:YkgJ family cysteine cluster protein [Deltaproteobacteria bacterium]
MDTRDDFPYCFEGNKCKICGGRCCRGSAGYVWISRVELEEMAEARKMTVPLFARQYVRQVQGRFSLQDRLINGEYFCCFFDRIAGACTIYQNRPSQCRTFPFWDKFKKEPQKLFDECPAVSWR